MKRPAASPLKSAGAKCSTRLQSRHEAATSSLPKKRPSAAAAEIEPPAPPVAQAFVALQRSIGRSSGFRSYLLGAFCTPEAAVDCAALAEEQCAWKPGDKVCFDLYEEQYTYPEKEHTESSPAGPRSMPIKHVEGIVCERKIGSIKHVVKYLVAIDYDQSLGPKGAKLKTHLKKQKKHDSKLDQLCGRKSGIPELRKGITGTTTLVEVPREYLHASDSCDEDDDVDAVCPIDGEKHANSDSEPAHENAKNAEDAFDNETDEEQNELDREDLEFIVEVHDLDAKVEKNIVMWVAHVAANRATDDELRVCASIEAANTYARKRFQQCLDTYKESLQSRKVKSKARQVSADELLGPPRCFLKASAKHSFAHAMRDGFFIAGICDYGEDDFSDLEEDEEIDFLIKAYKQFHWIDHCKMEELQPLPPFQLATCSRWRRGRQQSKGKGLKCQTAQESRFIYAALRTSRKTEDPEQIVLGLHSDVISARQKLAEMEKTEALENGQEVSVSLYKGYYKDLKGTIDERLEDTTSLYAISYMIKVNFNDEAKKIFGRPGIPLPASIPAIYGDKSCRLKKGIEGTTSLLKVPRELVSLEGRGFCGDDFPSFTVERAAVVNKSAALSPARNSLARLLGISHNGLPRMPDSVQELIYDFASQIVWASVYEPSTTGWDDRCNSKYFTTATAANNHARQAFKDRMLQLREIRDPEFLQPMDAPGGFRRLPAKTLLMAKYPKIRGFKNVIKKVDQCFTKTYKDGLFVGAISNYHGDHMDGCANPYMAEWWWVEKHLINAPSTGSTKPAKSGRVRSQRTDDDCSVS